MKDTTAVISGFALAILTPPCIYAICKGLVLTVNEGKEMKKAIMASIIALSAIGLVGCDRVEPGNVGIKVNKLGDDKGVGEVVGVGRYWTGWNTEVYIFRPSSR